jgi:zeta-carotene desaturase
VSEQGAADVVIVGAGLAGLAAAVALSGAGAKVRVVERKPYVGGRAYSYPHPALGEVIDSQHVMLGCCTNLVDLCRLAGADRHVRWYERITFLEPGGEGRGARASEIGAGDLPAPGHSTVSFLRAPMLGWKDKVRIAQGLTEFLRGVPADDAEAFSEWLRRTRQTELAVRHFWEPVIVGALNDGFERCSTRYAAQVFHESFLRSGEGGRLGIPAKPLSEFYAGTARLAEVQGAQIGLRCSVERIERAGDGSWIAVASDGERISAPAMLLALPFEQTAKLLGTVAEPSAEVSKVIEDLGHFEHAPITTVHVWIDRAVTELEHAALLDTRIQWMFNKTLIRRFEADATAAGEGQSRKSEGQYLELVISASFAELKQTREQIVGSALEELARFFPRVREAKVERVGVLKEARATFSVLPGMDRWRPGAGACGGGLFLAGDWTRTGWPSTMEGAVRSGRLAAEAIAGRRFLTPDLPASGLMRLLVR